ncbi:ATP binding protein [Penicillium longicatenatum]|nr:ATP binding protein [Penicillium longicatenatum]
MPLPIIVPGPSQIIEGYFLESENPAPSSEPWMSKPEVPSRSEIMGYCDADTYEDVILHPNRPSSVWSSATEYLGTHYELLREDAVAPLRDAVEYLRDCPDIKDTNKISVYDKVHIVRMTAATRGLAFRIRFSTKRAGKRIIWHHSSRLMTGSLVALSPVKDCFATKCVVATVASRTLENVEKYPPEVDIYFACPEDINIDFLQEWIMVEAKDGYFEASRYTLTALQKMVKERFPLSQYICSLNSNVAVAAKVEENPVLDLQSVSGVPVGEKAVYNILKDLPVAPMGTLNTLQWKALKEILTKGISLIQGPPGTGKTHVSVAALKIILPNMGNEEPPVIIAAQTNHAVDQILKLVSASEQNYIRLGGRTTDLEIRERTLHAIKISRPIPRMNQNFKNAKKELDRLTSVIMALSKPLEPGTSEIHINSSSFLEYGLLTSQQVDSLQCELYLMVGWNDSKGDDPLAYWLHGQISPFWVNYGEEYTESFEDDIDRMDEAKHGYESDDREILNGRFAAFDINSIGRNNSAVSEEAIRGHLQNPDLCKIPAKFRGSIYNHLRVELMEILNGRIRELAKQYQEASKRLLRGKWEMDSEILRGSKLIAMTTTGLSKYRALVASLNPTIVLIEEAAEILEGPITAACLESVQQLILVGDHKQLKGRCNLRDLAGPPFHLDLSMFERLVSNDMPYVMLQEQRRMIPEIRELLHPIYGELKDHPSVQEYPLIPGMGDMRSFFFTHSWPENDDSLLSKLNEMEAAMLVEFCVYLVMNGTPIDKITILTFYNGQRKLIYKLARRHKHSLLLQGAKIVTVDSYQGEENDIVLVSLVRSNSSQTIGFLGVDNRVCVALSRAKRGLFLFGNAELLFSSSPLWTKVLKIMTTNANNMRVGRVFKLTCKSHGRPINISAPGDWKDRNGGCQQDCGATLQCGHPCPISCHGFDHQVVVCTTNCNHIYLCCGVTCRRLCKEPHDHQCNCTLKTTTTRQVDDKDTDEVQRVIEVLEKAAIAGEFSRGPFQHGRAPRPDNKAFRHFRGSILKNSREIQRDLPDSLATVADAPHDDEARHNAARQKWQAFANGGAKEMDDHLNILYRAPDINSEQVKNAIANLDKAFIPREFWSIKEAQGLQNQESKVIKGPEWLQLQVIKEEQQSGDLKKSKLHVTKEKLLDLD